MTISTMTLGRDTLPPQRAAKIAGATYLITTATAVFADFYVRGTLVVSGDAARTASNIVAHALLFRVGIVCDLLTIAGVIVLNLALYELLAAVDRPLARLAAMFRLAEQSVYGAVTTFGIVVVSVLGGADYVEAFEPRQLQALARLFVSGRSSGYVIALLLLGVGQTIYMLLLLRSRYVPKALPLFVLGASVLFWPFLFGRILFPASVTAAIAGILGLPTAALVLLGVILAPLAACEVILGFWLLVKGVNVQQWKEQASAGEGRQ
jgi:hypothetical protein